MSSFNQEFNLPFPLWELSTPCHNVFHMNEGNSSNTFRSYHFTLPAEVFIPSPSCFLETRPNTIGKKYRQMITVIARLAQNMFFSHRPNEKYFPRLGRRYNLFLEYLLRSGASTSSQDIKDVSLLDCIGVRFHIILFDRNLNLMDGILTLTNKEEKIQTESSGEMTIEGNVMSGPAKKGTSKSKKKKEEKICPEKLPPYEAYRLLNKVHEWYQLCSNISREHYRQQDFTLDTTGGVQYIPTPDHPYHCDRFFSWEKSLIPGMHEAQRAWSESGQFPFPQLVYYIDDELANPFSILGMTLPRTPRWTAQNEEGMRNTFVTLRDENEMRLRFATLEESPKYNDLRDIGYAQRNRHKNLVERLKSGNYSPNECIMELRRFRDSSMMRLSKTWSTEAHVSEPIKEMARAMTSIKSWTSPAPVPVFDHRMSHFGNLIAHILDGLEDIFEVGTTHCTILRILVCVMDAYRYKFNLHSHVCLLGKGAIGKSFMLRVISKLLLPGTTESCTHETAKAMTTAQDENDTIKLYDEATPHQLGYDPTGADTGSAIVKSAMTECIVKTDSITVEDGKRKAIKAVSERVGCQILATNERMDKIPEALRSRFLFIRVNEVEREGFDVISRVTQTNALGREQRRGPEIDKSPSSDPMVRRVQVIQIMTNMVEKAIFLEALRDVDLNTLCYVQNKIMTYIKKETNVGVSKNATRDISALQRFARSLTIMNAVDKFVNDQSSSGYDADHSLLFDSPAAWERLKLIQPYLFCTEEIAYFTLSINADQIIRMHNFRALEVFVDLVSKTVQKFGDDDQWIQRDGYWESAPVFFDERHVYEAIKEIQSAASSYDEILSIENLKVAFNELKTLRFDLKPLIRIDYARQQLLINAEFVKKHFKFENDIGRYVCTISAEKILREAFYASCCNHYTREQCSLLTGNVPSRIFPYRLETYNKRPRPNKCFHIDVAVSTSASKVSESEHNEFFERQGPTMFFTNGNPEDYFYQEFLKDCGFDTASYSVENTLTKSTNPCNHTCVYPQDYLTRASIFLPQNSRKRPREYERSNRNEGRNFFYNDTI